ncbi:MAG: CopG family ribbon-helix-helix protein [Acidimicrobiales bacterium]
MSMRTTVSLDDDVAAAVDQVRRERSIGVSEAINELVRNGLVARPAPAPFFQRSARLELRIDVANVAEALEISEGPAGS